MCNRIEELERSEKVHYKNKGEHVDMISIVPESGVNTKSNDPSDYQPTRPYGRNHETIR